MENGNYGDKPKLAWLPVVTLHVDHAYQRTLTSERSQKRIAEMVENFRWRRFGTLTVSVDRKGGYLVMDGQHRVEALRRLKIDKAPCNVTEVLTLSEQAEIFLAANRDRVIVNPYALHRAQVVAGDKEAIEIDRVCKAAGCSIAPYPIPQGKLKPGVTLALGTIRKLISIVGDEMVISALKRLKAVDTPLKATFIKMLVGGQTMAAVKAHVSPKKSAIPATIAETKATVYKPISAGAPPKSKSASDQDAIAKHIAEKGVIKLPTAAVGPTQANPEYRRQGEVPPTRAKQMMDKKRQTRAAQFDALARAATKK